MYNAGMADSANDLPSWGTLLFTSVWLVLWSFGVAMIQIELIGGDWLTLLFAFSHGGSEVLVLYVVSGLLRKRALLPSDPERDTDVGGTRLTWRAGSSTVTSLAVSALLPLAVYPILCWPLVEALRAGPTVFQALLVAVFGATWLTTVAWLWLPTWRDQLAGLAQVTLEIAAHRMRITERWPLFERSLTFPAKDVTIERHVKAEYAELRLATPDQHWTGRIPKAASHAVAAVEGLVRTARERDADAEVPDELDALRAGPVPSAEV